MLPGLRVSPAREPGWVGLVSGQGSPFANDRAHVPESTDMKLDRTMTVAMGLAAAGLLTLGLTFRDGRAPTPEPPQPAPPPAERTCVAVVAEHAACALPPPHAAEQGGPHRASSLTR